MMIMRNKMKMVPIRSLFVLILTSYQSIATMGTNVEEVKMVVGISHFVRRFGWKAYKTAILKPNLEILSN